MFLFHVDATGGGGRSRLGRNSPSLHPQNGSFSVENISAPSSALHNPAASGVVQNAGEELRNIRAPGGNREGDFSFQSLALRVSAYLQSPLRALGPSLQSAHRVEDLMQKLRAASTAEQRLGILQQIRLRLEAQSPRPNARLEILREAQQQNAQGQNFSPENFSLIERQLHWVEAREQESRVETRGRERVENLWQAYESYELAHEPHHANRILDQLAQELRGHGTGGQLSPADRNALLIRLLRAKIELRNFENIPFYMGDLQRAIEQESNLGSVEGRWEAHGLLVEYSRLYQEIQSALPGLEFRTLMLTNPHPSEESPRASLPAFMNLSELSHRLQAENIQTADVSSRVAHLLQLSRAHSAMENPVDSLAAVGEAEDLLRHAHQGDALIRAVVLQAYSEAGLQGYLAGRVQAWLELDERRVSRLNAGARYELFQDWATLASGLQEVGASSQEVLAHLQRQVGHLNLSAQAHLYQRLFEDLSRSRGGRELNDSIKNPLLSSLRDQLSNSRAHFRDHVAVRELLIAQSNHAACIHESVQDLQSIARNLSEDRELLPLQASMLRGLLREREILEQEHNEGRVAILTTQIRHLMAQYRSDLISAREGLSDSHSSLNREGQGAEILNQHYQQLIAFSAQADASFVNDDLQEQLASSRGERLPERAPYFSAQTIYTEYQGFLNALAPAQRVNGLVQMMRGLAERADTGRLRDVFAPMLRQSLFDLPEPLRVRALMQLSPSLGELRQRLETQAESSRSAYGDSAANEILQSRDEVAHWEEGLWQALADHNSTPALGAFARSMVEVSRGHTETSRRMLQELLGDPAFQNVSDPVTLMILEVAHRTIGGDVQARSERILRLVNALANAREAAWTAEGHTGESAAIHHIHQDLPRFLSTLPYPRLPQTFEAALQLYSAAHPENARWVGQFEGALSRIPLRHIGRDGHREGSIWNLIRAMDHLESPENIRQALLRLREVVENDISWNAMGTEGRGDLGLPLQEVAAMLLEASPRSETALRNEIAQLRHEIPGLEEYGHWQRETFSYTTALECAMMAVAGYGAGQAAGLVLESLFGQELATVGARTAQYFTRTLTHSLAFNTFNSITPFMLGQGGEGNLARSSLDMAADMAINDLITSPLSGLLPVPRSMLGRVMLSTTHHAQAAATFRIAQNIRYQTQRATLGEEIAGRAPDNSLHSLLGDFFRNFGSGLAEQGMGMPPRGEAGSEERSPEATQHAHEAAVRASPELRVEVLRGEEPALSLSKGWGEAEPLITAPGTHLGSDARYQARAQGWGEITGLVVSPLHERQGSGFQQHPVSLEHSSASLPREETGVERLEAALGREKPADPHLTLPAPPASVLPSFIVLPQGWGSSLSSYHLCEEGDLLPENVRSSHAVEVVSVSADGVISLIGRSRRLLQIRLIEGSENIRVGQYFNLVEVPRVGGGASRRGKIAQLRGELAALSDILPPSLGNGPENYQTRIRQLEEQINALRGNRNMNAVSEVEEQLSSLLRDIYAKSGGPSPEQQRNARVRLRALQNIFMNAPYAAGLRTDLRNLEKRITLLENGGSFQELLEIFRNLRAIERRALARTTSPLRRNNEGFISPELMATAALGVLGLGSSPLLAQIFPGHTGFVRIALGVSALALGALAQGALHVWRHFSHLTQALRHRSVSREEVHQDVETGHGVPDLRIVHEVPSAPFVLNHERPANDNAIPLNEALPPSLSSDQQFNARVLAGEREALLEGAGVYYAHNLMAESIGGNAGPGHFGLNVLVNSQTGRIVSVGNAQNIPSHFFTGASHVVFRVMNPVLHPSLLSMAMEIEVRRQQGRALELSPEQIEILIRGIERVCDEWRVSSALRGYYERLIFGLRQEPSRALDLLESRVESVYYDDVSLQPLIEPLIGCPIASPVSSREHLVNGRHSPHNSEGFVTPELMATTALGILGAAATPRLLTLVGTELPSTALLALGGMALLWGVGRHLWRLVAERRQRAISQREINWQASLLAGSASARRVSARQEASSTPGRRIVLGRYQGSEEINETFTIYRGLPKRHQVAWRVASQEGNRIAMELGEIFRTGAFYPYEENHRTRRSYQVSAETELKVGDYLIPARSSNGNPQNGSQEGFASPEMMATAALGLLGFGFGGRLIPLLASQSPASTLLALGGATLVMSALGHQIRRGGANSSALPFPSLRRRTTGVSIADASTVLSTQTIRFERGVAGLALDENGNALHENINSTNACWVERLPQGHLRIENRGLHPLVIQGPWGSVALARGAARNIKPREDLLRMGQNRVIFELPPEVPEIITNSTPDVLESPLPRFEVRGTAHYDSRSDSVAYHSEDPFAHIHYRVEKDARGRWMLRDFALRLDELARDGRGRWFPKHCAVPLAQVIPSSSSENSGYLLEGSARIPVSRASDGHWYRLSDEMVPGEIVEYRGGNFTWRDQPLSSSQTSRSQTLYLRNSQGEMQPLQGREIQLRSGDEFYVLQSRYDVSDGSPGGRAYIPHRFRP